MACQSRPWLRLPAPMHPRGALPVGFAGACRFHGPGGWQSECFTPVDGDFRKRLLGDAVLCCQRRGACPLQRKHAGGIADGVENQRGTVARPQSRTEGCQDVGTAGTATATPGHPPRALLNSRFEMRVVSQDRFQRIACGNARRGGARFREFRCIILPAGGPRGVDHGL